METKRGEGACMGLAGHCCPHSTAGRQTTTSILPPTPHSQKHFSSVLPVQAGQCSAAFSQACFFGDRGPCTTELRALSQGCSIWDPACGGWEGEKKGY